jgi:DNA-binding NarL/FixJ family response regulator
LNRKEGNLDMAIEALHTDSERKPLGAVRVECHYPVVALALKEILKDEAHLYEEREQLAETGGLSSVILCPNGKDVTSEVKRLRASIPDAAILVFDMRVDPRLVQKALRAGASGFLHAGMSPEQIIRAVRLASEGNVFVPEGLIERLLVEEPAMADLEVLTHRQREIVELVCEGLSNAQIAERLFLTESTIKQHLYAVYKLLKVRNRIQVASLLWNTGARAHGQHQDKVDPRLGVE